MNDSMSAREVLNLADRIRERIFDTEATRNDIAQTLLGFVQELQPEKVTLSELMDLYPDAFSYTEREY